MCLFRDISIPDLYKMRFLPHKILNYLGVLHFLGVFLAFSCEPIKGQYARDKFQLVNSNYQYNIADPDKLWTLDNELDEISGLSYFNDSLLICVNDEKGHVYFFDYLKGEIAKELDFGKKGDYEGLEKVGNTIWVLESSGDLHEISIDAQDLLIIDVRKHDENLKKGHELEGLGFHIPKEQLLLACKKSPVDKDNKRKLFLSDETNRSVEDIYIDIKQVEDKLNEKGLIPEWHLPFFPSGVAMHPVTKEVFVLAHKGKLMLVYSDEFELIDVVPLPKQILPQPEGICFDRSGNLFLSTEGVGGKGKIIQCKNHRNE
ncbi:MAG TPA: hypothetical protein DDY13_08545 [Cytophagales bacterium]|jgi:uncharacterized protein YjiK|nr:hypothetical protein [Cytophagales bacterium]